MNQTILDAKKDVVNEIAEKFKASSSSVVVEYRGLSVTEVTQLRRELRKENVEFKVYKNSMATRAAEIADVKELQPSLTGPNAIAFGDDAVAPARILVAFAKKHKALVLKSGVVEGSVVNVETLDRLSKLPNRDGMISMLLGCFQSPVRSFACVIKAVKDQKEELEQA